jgi:zinc resistance-associated protein
MQTNTELIQPKKESIMKSKSLRTVFIGLITVAVVAAGASAFAGKGMGNRSGDGNGYHRYNQDCPYGYRNSDLTEEQQAQLNAERKAFFDATQDARQEIYAKRLALRAELAKKNADAKVAADLQKTISGLQADLDQKRIEHLMTMRGIDPDAGRGFFGGRGMGHHGHHRGHDRGMGGYGMGYGMGDGPGCRQ